MLSLRLFGVPYVYYFLLELTAHRSSISRSVPCQKATGYDRTNAHIYSVLQDLSHLNMPPRSLLQHQPAALSDPVEVLQLGLDGRRSSALRRFLGMDGLTNRFVSQRDRSDPVESENMTLQLTPCPRIRQPTRMAAGRTDYRLQTTETTCRRRRRRSALRNPTGLSHSQQSRTMEWVIR